MGNSARGECCRLGLRFEDELQTPAMLIRILFCILFLSLVLTCQENPSKAEHIPEKKEVVTTKEQQTVSFENVEYLDDDGNSSLVEGEDKTQELEISTVERQRCKNAPTESKSRFGKICFGWWKRPAGAHESCGCHPQTSSK